MQGMRIPQKKQFFVSEATYNTLVTVVKLSEKKPQNVLVKGMQGCGKSELAEQLAASLNRPFAEFQIGLLSESGQLFGQQTLKKGDVQYEKFLFIDAIQVPNAIILLDDFNRPEKVKALNCLFSVLDDRRAVWIDELHKTVEVAGGVIFFATANEGAEFTATEPIDAAIADRFFLVEMSNLPAEQERNLLVSRVGMPAGEAASLVSVLNGVRGSGSPVSTRKALAIASLVNAGLDMRQAFATTLGIDRDELEKVLLAVHLVQEGEVGKGSEKWLTL